MTSARLSRTLFLSFVRALKAAELKRCWKETKKTISPSQHYSTLLTVIFKVAHCVVLNNEKMTWKWYFVATFSNREILLVLTVGSKMRGAPRPKMSLRRGLNCNKTWKLKCELPLLNKFRFFFLRNPLKTWKTQKTLVLDRLHPFLRCYPSNVLNIRERQRNVALKNAAEMISWHCQQ